MAAARTSVRVERRDGVVLLRLENPSGFPRLEREILLRLLRALDRAAADADLAGVVITGTEKSFAAGAEIEEVSRLGPAAAREFSLLGQRLTKRVERSPKPIVAAIRGYCLGGALDLALACPIRVASEDARFAYPGAGLGILTGWGGTQRLARTLLPGAGSQALELFVTGRTLDAREAYLRGLISRIVPSSEVLSRAQALARGRLPLASL